MQALDSPPVQAELALRQAFPHPWKMPPEPSETSLGRRPPKQLERLPRETACPLPAQTRRPFVVVPAYPFEVLDSLELETAAETAILGAKGDYSAKCKAFSLPETERAPLLSESVVGP